MFGINRVRLAGPNCKRGRAFAGYGGATGPYKNDARAVGRFGRDGSGGRAGGPEKREAVVGRHKNDFCPPPLKREPSENAFNVIKLTSP